MSPTVNAEIALKTTPDSTLLRGSLTLDILTRSPKMETPRGEAAKDKIEKLWSEFYQQAFRIVVDLENSEILAKYDTQTIEKDGV